MNNTGSARVASIDVLRAITMYLMVFVNDLPSNSGVPSWLEHAPGSADAMGFSDIIFPAFLFIVGLSIPLAIERRLSRGQAKGEIFRHIILRSLALIIMGLFHVNLENYSDQALIPKAIWEILITLSFFLIWLEYKGTRFEKWKKYLQYTGAVMLVVLAIFYRGDTTGGTVWMRSQWWGILGLIGWAYLLCSAIILFAGVGIRIISIAVVFFLLFNIGATAGWLSFLSPLTRYGVLDLGNASNSALVMTGVLASVLYKKNARGYRRIFVVLLSIGIAGFILGFGLRPFWGISKIRATPSWIAITTGINIISFLVLIYLTDKKEKTSWFAILKPAGTSTLTCYLLPYFYYSIVTHLIHFRVPDVLTTGFPGIVKSLAFALVIVLITGWLERKSLRLKI